MTAFPPQLFLIGAQKSATTTLAFLLDQHPRIILANPKEPAFFTRRWSHGIDWYRQRFPAHIGGCVLVDATPGYTAAPLTGHDPDSRVTDDTNPRVGVPGRIKTISPEARFIYLVRDPVARTYSSYWHDVRQGVEHRSFREALKSNSFYVRTSDYAGQLKLFLNEFPIERFLFLTMEGLTADLVGTCQTCFRFAGVSPDEFMVVADQGHKNKSFNYSKVGRLLFGASGSPGSFKKLANIGKKILPETLKEYLQDKLTESIPPIPEEDRTYLNEVFRDSNAEFARLTGLDITHWSV